MTKIYFKVLLSALMAILLVQTSHAQCVTVRDTIKTTVCAGDSVLFNNTYYKRSTGGFGTRLPADTVLLGTGCDSITDLRLTVLAVIKDSISQAICTGSTYSFNGQTLSASGVYRDTFTSVLGCDSFVIVNLSVGGFQTYSMLTSICNGDSLLFNGVYRKRTGTYYDTLSTGGGCDSIVALYLTERALSSSTSTESFCRGNSYPFGGRTLTAPGNYRDTIVGGSVTGCDSTVILNLALTVSRGPATRDTICQGDTLFLPSGRVLVLTKVGNSRPFNDTILLTCSDSVTTYVVRVDSPATPMISASVNVLSETITGFASYQWELAGSDITGANQITWTATQNGTYTVEAWDSAGCSATSAPYTLTSITGFSVMSNNMLTRIYPNPNTGSFELETSNSAGSEVTIYDVLGKPVTQVAVTKDRMPLDLNIPDGVYILKVANSNGVETSLRFTVAK